MSTKLSQTPETFPQPSTPHIRLRIPRFHPHNDRSNSPQKTTKTENREKQTRKQLETFKPKKPPSKQKPK